MTLWRLVRLVPIGLCAVVGCTETLAPRLRLGAAPRFGDFLMSVDSVIVTPNPVARGDSVTIVLRGGQAAECIGWTVVTGNPASVETHVEPWGVRGNLSPCRRLQDAWIRIAAPEAAAVESFTVIVIQPRNRELHVRVGLTGPDPRRARPPARPTRRPAGDSAASSLHRLSHF
jgi:hypothetical protein